MKAEASTEVSLRLLPGLARHHARIISSDDSMIIVHVGPEDLNSVAVGGFAVLSWDGGEYYAKIVGSSGSTVHLQKLWSERRECFRVDDVFPVSCRKVDGDGGCRKARVLSGLWVDEPGADLLDDTIHPGLWKMLVDINGKLDLILEHLHLEREGLLTTANRRVNLSATGMRFTTGERVAAGDEVEIKMLLPVRPPRGVLIYGTVVRAETAPGGEYDIAVHFSDADSEVVDEIIHYALNRQREIIRTQRQQRGTNA